MTETDIDTLQRKLADLEARVTKLENPVIVEQLFPGTFFEEAEQNMEVK